MKTIISIYGILILIIAASVLVLSTAAAGANKVSICHVPPGNPDNLHTISISEKAVEAHLAENPLDYEGECNVPDASCSEEDSNLLIDPAFLEEDGALAMCGNDSKGNKNKLARCLSEEVGISESCGDCYGDFSKCWEKTCEDICSSGDGEACESCVNNTDCQDNFESCAGFEYPAPPLFQSTYKDLDCDCYDDNDKCTCSFNHRLSTSQTKEFRLRCTYSDDNVYYIPVDAGVTGKKSSTSCTIWIKWSDYISKSCTNWDPFSSDKLHPWVECKKINK